MIDTHTDHHEKRRTNWWPLLMIPLFFVVGWWSRGVAQDPNNNPVESQVQGIEEYAVDASASPMVPGVEDPRGSAGFTQPNIPEEVVPGEDTFLEGEPEVPGVQDPTFR